MSGDFPLVEWNVSAKIRLIFPEVVAARWIKYKILHIEMGRKKERNLCKADLNVLPFGNSTSTQPTCSIL